MELPRIRTWRRLLTAAVVLTVLTSAVPAAAHAGGGYPERPPAPGAGPAVPHLDWGFCGEGAPEGLECATATVPLDHRRPHWRTIDLALARIPAGDPTRRVGSLFVNPGGPGASGIDVVADPSAWPDPVRERFDIVGFDPRGVGRSGQVRCWSPGRYLREYAQATGTAAGGGHAFRRTVAQARQFDSACRRNSGEVLPYLGTAYVARDLDLLRAAVGDRKLTFLGASYGTYLGNVYAAMFPDRVRALALDSPLDPLAYTYAPASYARRRLVAGDAALRRAFEWCVATPGECSFGDGDPVRAWSELIARLDRDPITVTGEEGLPVTTNANLLSLAVSMALFDGKPIWPPLMDALDQLDRAGGGPLTDFFFLDEFAFLSPNAAVDCADTAASYPDDLGVLERVLARNAAAAPLMGSALTYGPPALYPHVPVCATWSSPSVSGYRGSLRVRGIPAPLVIGITGDPATDYRSAPAMARLLGGRLLRVEGEGHVAFTSNPCVGQAVVDYLVTRTLPAPGATCPGDTV